MHGNLFFPIQSDLPLEVKKLIFQLLENGIKIRNKILEETKDYYQAKMFMSIQRLFHKSRINEAYTLLEKEDYIM